MIYCDLILTDFDAIITLRLTHFYPVSTHFDHFGLLGLFFGEFSVWVSLGAAFGGSIRML